MALDNKLLAEMDSITGTKMSVGENIFKQMDIDSGFTPKPLSANSIKDLPPVGDAEAIAGAAALAGAGAAKLAGGAAKLGKAAGSKAFELLARSGAGLSPKTLETVNRVGFSRVQEIGEKGGEYLANKIVPKARENVLRSISFPGKNATDALDNLGFKPHEVEALRGISKERMEGLSKQASGNWSRFNENLEKATQATGKKIGNVYDTASKIGVDMNLPRTYGTMRRELKGYGLIDEMGNLTRDAETISSASLKGLAKTYQEIHSTIKGKGKITVPQYRNMISQLEGYLGQEEKFNVPIYKTIRTLRDEGADVLNKSAHFRNLDIKKLNKEYSENVALSNLSKKLNDVINEAPDKLESTFNRLAKDKNVLSRDKYIRMYGKSVMDDIDAVAAAGELYPEKMGGWWRTGYRQAVKAGMGAKEAVGKVGKSVKQIAGKSAKGALGAMGGRLQRIAGKGLKTIAPISMILDAMSYAEDPEAKMLELYGYDSSNLAPKGSEERKIQLGQIT